MDLQDELRAQGELSRMRLIRDMLAGALLVRPTRWAYLIIAAALLIGGLAVVSTSVGGRGTDLPAPPSRAELRLTAKAAAAAVPYRSCLVARGSCSLTPCTQFAGQPSSGGAAVYSSPPTARGRQRGTATRCAAYPRVRPQHPVFVSQ